jgi:hypothetical protein
MFGGVALKGVGHKAWQMIKRSGAPSKPEEQHEHAPESDVPLRADDPLWRIVGLGSTTGPTNLSENVDKNLAEEYRADMHAAP